MSTVAHEPMAGSAIVTARDREDVVVGNEIIRHRRTARLIHWSVALTFFICVLSGMPIWTPVFGWMAYFVGGLEAARVIHPYAGVLFFVASFFMFFDWLSDMRMEKGEGSWIGPRLLSYVRWETGPAPDEGKYNGGQKVYFYMVSVAALVMMLTGLPMWFPLNFPSWLRQISILLHDVTFIFFIISIVGHIYLGTAAEPGTFRSMTRGTVTRQWAKFHHPGWYRQVTGEEKRKA